LKIIWKAKLAGAAFSSPVILGRLVTHRGTVELVFVLSSSGYLYAVDGDFGKIFWTRRLASFRNQPPTPVLAPPAPDYNEEEDDDVPQPLRPLYALSGDGRLHVIHPGLGSDLTVWRAAPSVSLNLEGNEVVGGSWRIDVSRPESKPVFRRGEVLGRSLTAKWEDARGLKWRYEAKAGRVEAFAGSSLTWTWRGEVTAAPVVGGGLVFLLARNQLTALDAASGRVLYTSGNAVIGTVRRGEMALANGHLCFVTDQGVLYCFGFPVDR
jgi:outer membrane protein assembly factor BamB